MFGCHDAGENVCSPALKFVLINLKFYFRTLEVILLRLEILLPRNGRKRLFAGFKIGFTSFAVLLLEHWRLHFVDWWYICQDTGKNVYLLSMKLDLRHLPLYF